MKNGLPDGTTCPQCGAPAAPEASACAACGLRLVALPSEEWQQPAFERRGSWLMRAGDAAPTALAFACHPESAFRHFHLLGGFRDPLIYTVLLGGPPLLLGVVLKVLLIPSEVAFVPGNGTLPGPLMALALVFVVPPLYVYIRAQAVHLGLVLRGRVQRPFEVTFRLVAYANASVAPMLILPIVGDFVFLALGALVETVGLRECQRLSAREACLAEVLPAMMLLLGFLAILVVGFLWWSQGQS